MTLYRLRYKPHHGAGPTKDNPHPGMAAFLVSDQAREPVVAAAKDIADLAKQLAPRGKGTGVHMADQFRVNEHTPPVNIGGNPRVGAEVYNGDPAAAPNEFGGRRNPRHRMLGRAGARIGEWKGEVG